MFVEAGTGRGKIKETESAPPFSLCLTALSLYFLEGIVVAGCVLRTPVSGRLITLAGYRTLTRGHILTCKAQSRCPRCSSACAARDSARSASWRDHECALASLVVVTGDCCAHLLIRERW